MRNRDALYADELQSLFRRALGLQAQLYGFANALGDLVQRTGLCMACRDLRNRGDVIAFPVALNDDIELAWHGESSHSIVDFSPSRCRASVHRSDGRALVVSKPRRRLVGDQIGGSGFTAS